jgi:CO dehydrogenase maturation factor
MTNTSHSPLLGSKIGIFGKGGAGKSTVTVLLARALHRQGHEVVVVDADSTNVGLAEALGFERTPTPLVDHFGGMVFGGGAVTCPVDDPTPLPGADLDLDSVDTTYVGRTEGIRLLVLGKMGGLGAGSGCDGPISKIARDLRPHEGDRDAVTLLDFKAGFEDSARGVLIGIDAAVAVVDATPAAVHMAADLTHAVDAVRQGALPATAHLGDAAQVELARQLYRGARVRGVVPVLNRIGDAETEHFVRGRLRELGVEPAATIPETPTITRAWMQGETLGADAFRQPMDRVIESLEEVLMVGGESP